MEFPSERAARVAMVEVGRRLYARALINGGEGNLSCRLGPRRLLCTPAGVNKGFLSEDQLVVTDLEGDALHELRRPSSELLLHLACYEERDDCVAVVHAHPPHAAPQSPAPATGHGTSVMASCEYAVMSPKKQPAKCRLKNRSQSGRRAHVRRFACAMQTSSGFGQTAHETSCADRASSLAPARPDGANRTILFDQFVQPLVDAANSRRASLADQDASYPHRVAADLSSRERRDRPAVLLDESLPPLRIFKLGRRKAFDMVLVAVAFDCQLDVFIALTAPLVGVWVSNPVAVRIRILPRGPLPYQPPEGVSVEPQDSEVN